MKDNDDLMNVILDKITYMCGYFTGVSNVLRSSGNIDPLALSSDFASMQKDMLLLKDSIITLLIDDADLVNEAEAKISEEDNADD